MRFVCPGAAWIDAQFRANGPGYAYDFVPGVAWNQAWVGVQHTAPGAFLSVGHSATELNNFYNCLNDNFFTNSFTLGARAPARTPSK